MADDIAKIKNETPTSGVSALIEVVHRETIG
jgi:hypothetical protein